MYAFLQAKKCYKNVRLSERSSSVIFDRPKKKTVSLASTSTVYGDNGRANKTVRRCLQTELYQETQRKRNQVRSLKRRIDIEVGQYFA